MFEPYRISASPDDVLGYWARERPARTAYILLADRGSKDSAITFAELDARTSVAAGQIAERTQPGDRALLLFHTSLDFIVAFFGCLRAGVIAVPMMVPRRTASRDSSAAILADCAPELVITNGALCLSRPDVIDDLASTFTLLVLQTGDEAAASATLAAPRARPRNEIAFLQYTSGSTSAPKGVVVTHRNLVENLEMIRRAFGNTEASTYVSWVPLYHDMGLILNVLQSLYVGATCVLMSPAAFMQQPMAWLDAISRYRAEVAGGPNFAFDLCASRLRDEQLTGIDLSCWKVAFNGAEPVGADTLARFAAKFATCGFDPKALYPCYGLAEGTLLVSGGWRGRPPVIAHVARDGAQQGSVTEPADDARQRPVVGCGRHLVGERIAIVDPDNHAEMPALAVGEIWVSGPNVAKGYWRNAEATKETFGAILAGQTEAGPWLRTGDLGFVDATGELFVTGRIKDLIIIRGNNHYPQDLENTVQNCHPSLRRNGGAAFAVLNQDQNEMLVVVQEVERTARHGIDVEDVAGTIREAVVNDHEIAVGTVVLVKPGTIPKTTSGKIQRSLTRLLWQQGRLDVIQPADRGSISFSKASA
jgi:acyl-CoA synthetase (AMP-forming)/AMP-acid ligase II